MSNITGVTHELSLQFKFLAEFDQLKVLDAACHIDMLHFGLPNINRRFLKYRCMKTKAFESPQFRICRRYICINSGIEFSVLREPRNPNARFYQVQLNPKHFMTYIELRKFAEEIAGFRLRKNNHKVQRLDIAFTSPVLIPDMIHYCTQMKWKDKATTYTNSTFKGGNLSGLRTLSKSMNFSAYTGYNKFRSPDIVSDFGARVEFQVKGSSLISLGLSRIPMLATINIDKIFDRMNFFDIRCTEADSIKKIQRFENFQFDVLQLGFQQARLRHNKHGNFMREVGNYLKPLSINNGQELISDCFKKSFTSWFQKWLREPVKMVSDHELIE